METLLMDKPQTPGTQTWSYKFWFPILLMKQIVNWKLLSISSTHLFTTVADFTHILRQRETACCSVEAINTLVIIISITRAVRFFLCVVIVIINRRACMVFINASVFS